MAKKQSAKSKRSGSRMSKSKTKKQIAKGQRVKKQIAKGQRVKRQIAKGQRVKRKFVTKRVVKAVPQSSMKKRMFVQRFFIDKFTRDGRPEWEVWTIRPAVKEPPVRTKKEMLKKVEKIVK